MPNDNNREMLTEVVALYLAAHMKAQAAVITTLVSILVQKGVLTEQIVRAEWLGGLEEVVRATLESPQATNPDEARASRIEAETLRQVVDWIRQRLRPNRGTSRHWICQFRQCWEGGGVRGHHRGYPRRLPRDSLIGRTTESIAHSRRQWCATRNAN